LLAFQFVMHSRPDLANLPSVPVPFGISLFSVSSTDSDLQHLIGLKNLKRLDLSFTKLTDKGLTHLQRLTELEHLKLTDTQTDPANLQKLREALPDCVIER
jgi:Leucine-rich repeat (LRR) protein